MFRNNPRFAPAGAVLVGADSSSVATRSAATDRPRPAQLYHCTLRREMVSMSGAITSTPPRIKSITNTMEMPVNVYASVVVTTMVAVQRPLKNVQSVGDGTLKPAMVRWVAYCHQPMPVRKRNIPHVD